MSNTSDVLTPHMISDYCQKRIFPALPRPDAIRLQDYMVALVLTESRPPMVGGKLDWRAIGVATGIKADDLRARAAAIRPAFDAITRSVRQLHPKLQPTASQPRRRKSDGPVRANVSIASTSERTGKKKRPGPERASAKRKTGVPPRPIVEFPDPLWTEWIDPPTFPAALALHMRRHGDTPWHLHRAVVTADEDFDRKTLITWCDGTKSPRSVASFEVLCRIEARYRLPPGYFKAKLAHRARAATGFRLSEASASEQRRLAWHLPDDFDERPREEQGEILAWVRTVVISGSTDYRRFQAAAMRQRYSIRFRNIGPLSRIGRSCDDGEMQGDASPTRIINAPAELEREMAELLRFKTSTLSAFGYQRNGVWGDETASQKVEHLGLMFGALAAPPRSAVSGFGVRPEILSFGMLVFPAVWDWYVQWREKRRGFYTSWEVDMVRVAAALTRSETGWIRQSPHLAARIVAIEGLVSQPEIEAARADWGPACDTMHKHALGRAKEIDRVARVHRDPFEPILPVLEAASPVAEYRKITEEILRLMPDERLYPRSAAESVRSFLLLRFGLHLGLRQKNLRQLLLCARDGIPRTERQLTELRCGELRWNEMAEGWEVLIPSVAFKNASSSFFGSKPFRLVLPDLSGLYRMIDSYIDRHRRNLIGPADDPGTFFVKTAKHSSTNAAYDQNTFYEAWRRVTERYGVYNPYTGRGAIKGLLPHGPHNVRDVLATHILKQTGSYEQASYAIQDTPEMVAEHYGRFLPQDKSALAAQILNRVWEVVQ